MTLHNFRVPSPSQIFCLADSQLLLGARWVVQLDESHLTSVNAQNCGARLNVRICSFCHEGK